jgi:hypothetical protein
VSVLNPAAGLKKSVLGVSVARATATLPATTQGAIFTVAGGRVLVTSLIGTVTTAIQNQACTLKITGNPTTGTDVDLATATAVTAKEVGSIITLPAAAGGAVVVANAGGALVPIGSGLVRHRDQRDEHRFGEVGPDVRPDRRRRQRHRGLTRSRGVVAWRTQSSQPLRRGSSPGRSISIPR